MTLAQTAISSGRRLLLAPDMRDWQHSDLGDPANAAADIHDPRPVAARVAVLHLLGATVDEAEDLAATVYSWIPEDVRTQRPQ